MIFADLCSSGQDIESRRSRFQQRKLEFLKYTRDSIERRLAAINASITTLEAQINR